MPIYEYECSNDDCKHTMERMKPRWNCDEPETCPKCNGWMKRMISRSDFQFVKKTGK